MAHTIEVVTTVKINGSQVASFSRSIEAEATDSIAVTVYGSDNTPSGADSNKEVALQPDTTIGQVTFIGITANRYEAGLTYKVNDEGNPAIPLDQPQILFGQGAVGLLDAAEAPTKLYFSSTLEENAEIQILVGRDATPEPPVS